MTSNDPEAASDIPIPQLSLEGELREVLSRHSAENVSGTPDFILAQYLFGCMTLFHAAVRLRESWYGRGPVPFSERPPGSIT